MVIWGFVVLKQQNTAATSMPQMLAGVVGAQPIVGCPMCSSLQATEATTSDGDVLPISLVGKQHTPRKLADLT